VVKGIDTMKNLMSAGLLETGVLAMFATAMCFAAPADTKPASIAPATMPRIGTIDERYQSYNIEMVEVTGGRFWKPYDSKKVEKIEGGNQPAIVVAGLFEYRMPIDLSNARLRKLAAALGPAYVRVSGT
jgi:heparanase 1